MSAAPVVEVRAAVWPAPPSTPPSRPRHRHAAESSPRVLPAWPVAVCRVAVAAVLVALACLVLGAVAPRLAGFDGHVVASGSMAPRLAVGDVVLTRPVSPDQLQPGQVLLFTDPDRPDRLLLHRLVSFDDQGRLVTRGDANQSNDSAHVPVSSVLGQAQVRVPYVGLPAYWRLEGDWGRIAGVALLLVAATVFVVQGRVTGGGTPSAPAAGDAPRPDDRAAARRYRHRPGFGRPPLRLAPRSR